MRFAIRMLTPADAAAILGWHYDPPYDVYDMATDPGDDDELRAAAAVGDPTWCAVDDAKTGELVGFLDLKPGEGELELGLGLRPDLTGRGLGPSFVEAAMAHGLARWPAPTVWLDVLPWNERAMRAYEKAGFVRGEVYVRRFPNGAEVTFLRMTRPASAAAPDDAR
jgi:ribosomal-protein-alanine N-acetyltransferase